MLSDPIFSITPPMLLKCTEIAQLLGRYEGLLSPKPQPLLRRQNRIRTIRDSLAIEGNTLSLDQVSALFDGKRVVGPQREILEVTNAIQVYDEAPSFVPLSSKDLRKAHGILMKGLAEDAGKWRSSDVGILKGSRISHLAPRANRIPELMESLFAFVEARKEIHALILSSIFHYELEFIHPFSDGNGRMGRLWQHVILLQFHPLFENIPVESIVKKHQETYYEVLEKSDKGSDCSPFIDFSLQVILEGLREFLDVLRPEPVTVETRLEKARVHFGKRKFSRKDYLNFFKSLSTATASRDLQNGVKKKLLKKSGDKALAQYVFV
jgi:Fic family protein